MLQLKKLRHRENKTLANLVGKAIQYSGYLMLSRGKEGMESSLRS